MTVLIVIGFIAAIGIGVCVGIQQESAPPNPEIVCWCGRDGIGSNMCGRSRAPK